MRLLNAAASVLLFQIVGATYAYAVTADEAFEMTVSEFDAASQDDKGVVLGTILDALVNYYLANDLADRAECMAELHEPSSGVGTSMLLADIAASVGNADTDHLIGDVIIATVELNCGNRASN